MVFSPGWPLRPKYAIHPRVRDPRRVFPNKLFRVLIGNIDDVENTRTNIVDDHALLVRVEVTLGDRITPLHTLGRLCQLRKPIKIPVIFEIHNAENTLREALPCGPPNSRLAA